MPARASQRKGQANYGDTLGRREDTHCLFVVRERLVDFPLLRQTLCQEIVTLRDRIWIDRIVIATASRRWVIASSVLPRSA